MLIMIFGMTIFTFVHVLLSLMGSSRDSSLSSGCLPQNDSMAGPRPFWRAPC